MPSMVGVRRTAASHHPYQVSGYDCVVFRPTDASLWLFTKWIDATRSLQADSATQPGFTKTALRLR
jgi:hypothetical protein